MPENDKPTTKNDTLAEHIGRFIIEFSDLESYLAYDIVSLIRDDSRGSDDIGRILGSHVPFGNKVMLFESLCRHRNFISVVDELQMNTYNLKEVVSKLHEIGNIRNRLAHDNIWASPFQDSAQVVRLNRKGDPHGDGWLTDLFPSDVDANRSQITETMNLLSKFMLSTHAERRRQIQPN